MNYTKAIDAGIEKQTQHAADFASAATSTVVFLAGHIQREFQKAGADIGHTAATEFAHDLFCQALDFSQKEAGDLTVEQQVSLIKSGKFTGTLADEVSKAIMLAKGEQLRKGERQAGIYKHHGPQHNEYPTQLSDPAQSPDATPPAAMSDINPAVVIRSGGKSKEYAQDAAGDFVDSTGKPANPTRKRSRKAAAAARKATKK